MAGWQGDRYEPADQETWDRLRADLALGQVLTGTVVWAPARGGAGIGVDVGLAVGGWVDVLQLPRDTTKWPSAGTVTEFWIWWMDERPQIRLLAVDPAYRVEDFDTWLADQDTHAAEVFRRRLTS